MNPYISTVNQLIGVKQIFLTDGKAAGMRAILVDNNRGLSFTLLTDRGMDLYDLRYRGKLISYLSAAGPVHPHYYQPCGERWMTSFSGGFLTTCGLRQVGPSCEYQGSRYGLHGNISNTPAEEVTCQTNANDLKATVRIRGLVRDAEQQSHHLLLIRTVAVSNEENVLLIEDEIKNEYSKASPFMLLYHFNFGFPFLTPELLFHASFCETTAFVGSTTCPLKAGCYSAPTDTPKEHLFVHTPQSSSGKISFALQSQDTLVQISYNGAILT